MIFYSEQMVEYIVYVCILEWGNSVTETDNCIQVRFKEKKSSSVQSLSRVGLFATPWITARQASLFITNPRSLLKLRSIESVRCLQIERGTHCNAYIHII